VRGSSRSGCGEGGLYRDSCGDRDIKNVYGGLCRGVNGGM
jgi:hypothetical protein